MTTQYGPGRLTTQHTTYGDDWADWRVWVADAPGIIRHYYLGSDQKMPSHLAQAEAISVINQYGDNSLAAGLEERIDGEWSEWMDDRGCDICEIIDEQALAS